MYPCLFLEALESDLYLNSWKPILKRLQQDQDTDYLKCLSVLDTFFSDVLDWTLFIDALVCCAYEYQKGEADIKRQAIRDYEQKTYDVYVALDELIQKIELLKQLGEQCSIINQDVESNPISLLIDAAQSSDPETQYRFSSSIKPVLERIIYQYDLKYYPGLIDILRTMRQQYCGAIETLTPVHEQTNKANDFLFHFFKRLNGSRIPEVKLKNKLWSALFSVALGYEVTEQNIKDFKAKKIGRN